MKTKRNKANMTACMITIVFILMLVLVIGGTVLLHTGNQREYTITNVYIQTELQHSADEGGAKYSTKYLYFCTTDSGEEIVFENEDNIFFGKFNSSTVLAKMRKYEQNKAPFKIKTAGYRIGFFSMYQNIIDVYEI